MCQLCLLCQQSSSKSVHFYLVGLCYMCGSNGFDACLIQVLYCVQIVGQNLASLSFEILNFVVVIDVAQVDFNYVLIILYYY